MIEQRLALLWNQLQGKKPHIEPFLSEMRLDGIRGFRNLRVRFDYPVSVIAGGNATGKVNRAFRCGVRLQGARCPHKRQ